jgi:hypothetical protein
MSVKPKDQTLHQALHIGLDRFEEEVRALPGIADPESRSTLLEQMIASVHRVRYPSVIRERPLSAGVADPTQQEFDPIKAAVIHQRQGNLEESFWLVFLFVHFGKHSKGGWRYLREVYGGLGNNTLWTWEQVSNHFPDFRLWLTESVAHIARKTEPGGFGNHRKYESLKHTSDVIESYIGWVAPPRAHTELIADALARAEGDQRKAFGVLYKSLDAVKRFGRTARFDYLAMLGKLELADIIPDRAYLDDATGPLTGARLLFGGSPQARFSGAALEQLLGTLDVYLNVGMQVLEDSLCNWQKSPRQYQPFRG